MVSFDLNAYPYPARRSLVLGQRAAVATSQPLASLAGMEMLLAGGNAVDAAVAMAIALTVVEPTANGIGGDAFALVWDGQLHGLNASGQSPQAMTPDQFAGLSRVPPYDWRSVTVPGAVSAWVALSERWGRLPFAQLFAPAIRYAEQGFPVSPVTAYYWQLAERIYLPRPQPEFQPFKAVFFPGDRAPRAGEIWRSPRHAATLRAIAQSHGQAFYTGDLAAKLVAFASATGGLIAAADLAQHQAEWVTPIGTDYRGLTVWEPPPNGQGIAALLALNILEGFDLAAQSREAVDVYHWQIEAMKLAFADAQAQVADPRWLQVPPAAMLDKDYARQRRSQIGERALPQATPGLPQGGTVYLATAEPELMVSFIQSNFEGFGSGILVPETAIALHNRATGFTLAAGHPNQVAPGKRPFHTIMPGFLTREGQAVGPFGMMGGPMQPQGHVQVVSNLVDFGLNPQAALDCPRWQFVRDNRVLLEPSVPPSVVAGLAARGHQVRSGNFFGRGQVIWAEQGVFLAATESRADGLAIAR